MKPLAPLLLSLALAACAAQQPPVLSGIRDGQEVRCTEPLADEPDAPRRGSMVGRSAAVILSEGMFRACEAYLNGALDSAGYQQQIAAYPRLAAGLMSIEALGWGHFPNQVPATESRHRPPTRVEAIEEIMETLSRPEFEEGHRRGPRQ